ncbi:Rha family transcriptional regulator [Streptococcus himalayensis]|uniref:Phage protein n=1 Tax=Streptococcus himalayensis TaxID=1888195 RepID=A0A917A9H1_9STRE|nr:Rha family transcriptional regulator [Streptococcus himalayensis]QBX08376.1 hypothetical protein JavanS256_0004 [Streptococcus satellite phage Javan256]GGE36858.1 hypothetical protein GCM10011510_17780 [Streptococcus himalayensis]
MEQYLNAISPDGTVRSVQLAELFDKTHEELLQDIEKVKQYFLEPTKEKDIEFSFEFQDYYFLDDEQENMVVYKISKEGFFFLVGQSKLNKKKVFKLMLAFDIKNKQIIEENKKVFGF